MSGPLGEYTTMANRETLVVIHIETMEAVEAIEEFIEVDGLDVLFLGPTDLSQSLGVPGQIHHPEVEAAMRRVAEAWSHQTRRWGSTPAPSKWPASGVTTELAISPPARTASSATECTSTWRESGHER